MDVKWADEGSRLPIRPATTGDYERIAAVWLDSGLSCRTRGRDSERAFRRQVEHFPDSYLVAVDGDRIIGVVLGSHDHRKGWINRLAVLPAYHRQGVATALVRACEDALQSCGIEIIAAQVESDNDSSSALFEYLGFSEYEVRYYRKLSNPDA